MGSGGKSGDSAISTDGENAEASSLEVDRDKGTFVQLRAHASHSLNYEPADQAGAGLISP